MFSCFIRRQKSSLCRKKMKHQPKKELLPHSSTRDKKEWRSKASQSRPLRLSDGSDRWALKDALQKKNSEHQGLSFFFPRYETNPGNRSLSEHHLTHQLFFVFLFQFWKTKTVFLVRKHARTASLIAAFPVFVIATPLRNILLTTDNKMFSYLLKRKEEKPDLIHSFNCLIILPVNVISPYGLKPAFKPPAHFPRT